MTLKRLTLVESWGFLSCPQIGCVSQEQWQKEIQLECGEIPLNPVVISTFLRVVLISFSFLGARPPFKIRSKEKTGTSLTYKMAEKDRRTIPARVLFQEDTQLWCANQLETSTCT